MTGRGRPNAMTTNTCATAPPICSWPSSRSAVGVRWRSPTSAGVRTGRALCATWWTGATGGGQARPGHGPAQYPLPGLALRGVRARGGQAPRRPARDPPHPQARLLAQYGRDRVERPRPRPRPAPGQALPNRVGDRATLERHVQAWQHRRNAAATRADWQFTAKDARIKLRKLYPTMDE